MKKALRGLNLGGWLVLEAWMNHEIFAGISSKNEINIVRELGYEAARERINNHRDVFITEDDFKRIKGFGFDFVRLPVGYWLFEKTDGFVDGEMYVKKAFTWAERHDLGVILDFHGLQGFQNKHDHSGNASSEVGFYKSDNTKKALKTLEYIASSYGHERALIGIEVINEPLVNLITVKRLLKYYDEAVKIVKRHTSKHVKIIVSDAFRPIILANLIFHRRYGQRVVLDMHLYQVFSWWNQPLSFRGHIIKTQIWWRILLKIVSYYTPVLIGEWSAALPDRAYKCATGSDETDRTMRYYNEQQGVFEKYVWAHSYWTYKSPGCGAWDWQGNLVNHQQNNNS